MVCERLTSITPASPPTQPASQHPLSPPPSPRLASYPVPPPLSSQHPLAPPPPSSRDVDVLPPSPLACLPCCLPPPHPIRSTLSRATWPSAAPSVAGHSPSLPLHSSTAACLEGRAWTQSVWGRGRGRLTSRECVRGWGCEWSLFNCSFYHPCPHITPPRELAARLWREIYYWPTPCPLLPHLNPATSSPTYTLPPPPHPPTPPESLPRGCGGTSTTSRTHVSSVASRLKRGRRATSGPSCSLYWSHCTKYTARFWVSSGATV